MLTLEPKRQGASQGPQDDYERYGRESGLQHAGGEIDGGLGRDPQVPASERAHRFPCSRDRRHGGPEPYPVSTLC